MATMRRMLGWLVVLGLAYLLLWPVPIDPVAWEAPEDAGYTGDFAPNERLTGVRRIGLGPHVGPEDVIRKGFCGHGGAEHTRKTLRNRGENRFGR